MIIKRHLDLDNKTRKTLVKLYITTFADPPYNEKFTKEYVNSYFDKYLKQYFYVGYYKNKPISLICAENNMDFGNLNNKLEDYIDLKSDIYFSEFIVDKNFRGYGFGTMLFKFFKSDVFNHSMYVRTSKNNNDKVIKLYEKFGFNIIDNVVQPVQNLRTNGLIDYDDRIFMVLQNN